jgi:hypothetical protein
MGMGVEVLGCCVSTPFLENWFELILGQSYVVRRDAELRAVVVLFHRNV